MAIAPIILCLLHHTLTNLQILLIIWPYDFILSYRTHQKTKLHQSTSTTLSGHDILDPVGSMETSTRQSKSTSKEHPDPSPPSFILLISESSDTPFFIQYTPEGTIQRRWYLVQVDIPSTASLNLSTCHPGLFHCVFLQNTPLIRAKWWC